MDDKVESILQGSVGLFQVQEGERDLVDGDVLPGYAQLQDEHVRIELINSSPSLFMPSLSMPSALTAATRDTGAAFFDIARVRADTRVGSNRVSTDEYFARAFAANVPLSDLRSASYFHSFRLFFLGIEHWADVSGSQVETQLDERKKLESAMIELRSAPPQVTSITGSLDVTLSTHWYISGPRDRRLLYAPTSIEVSSRQRPRHWRDLLRPLLQIQNVISLAHGGFVVADGGTVSLDVNDDASQMSGEAVTAPLWASRLMTPPAGVSTPKSMDEVPAFNLPTMGGMAGLRRWLSLATRYPRAVGPVSGVTQWSSQAVETRYLEVCAAVDYWVNRHKRTAKWARASKNPIAALAAHIGRPFTEWMAMPGDWAEQAWDHNGALKHNPSLIYDPMRTRDLAASVTLLLQCALIDRAAGTREAGRTFCESHRHSNMVRATRSLLQEAWTDPDPRSRRRK